MMTNGDSKTKFAAQKTNSTIFDAPEPPKSARGN